MGKYRTGKSFILDLMIKYLQASQKEQGPSTLPRAGRELKQKGATIATDSDKAKPGKYDIPQWLAKHGVDKQLNELFSADGFHFQGGSTTVTRGIYLYPQPFIKTVWDETTG